MGRGWQEELRHLSIQYTYRDGLRAVVPVSTMFSTGVALQRGGDTLALGGAVALGVASPQAACPPHLGEPPQEMYTSVSEIYD